MNIIKGAELLKKLKKKGFQIPEKFEIFKLNETCGFPFELFYSDCPAGVSCHITNIAQEWLSGSVFKVLASLYAGSENYCVLISKYGLNPKEVRKFIIKNLEKVKEASRRAGLSVEDEDFRILTFCSWNDEMVDYTYFAYFNGEKVIIEANYKNPSGWNFSPRIRKENGKIIKACKNSEKLLAYVDEVEKMVKTSYEIAKKMDEKIKNILLEIRTMNDKYCYTGPVITDAYSIPYDSELSDLKHATIIKNFYISTCNL